MKILDDQVVYSTFLMIIGIKVWLTISPWERKGKGERKGKDGGKGNISIERVTVRLWNLNSNAMHSIT